MSGRSRLQRVLVTGAAGFLGSHLVDRLLAEGCHVIGVDNLETGHLQNIAHLKNRKGFEFFRHDIVESLDFSVGAIFNFACPASPVHYRSRPIQTVKTSVIGTLNVLELARRNDAVLVQASTSEVYGDPTVHPQDESYWGNVNPIGVRACYDEGKRCAETLCFDFSRQHGLDIKVARIFNTYGPRLHPGDGRVISNFIVQALAGKPLTIYGCGNQTRSFCYVDDLIEGFMRLALAAPGFGGPVNLGNPDEYSMKELAGIVLELTNSRGGVVHLRLPEDDPKQRRPDIGKAREMLGWQPSIGLRLGLQKTIEHFRNH